MDRRCYKVFGYILSAATAVFIIIISEGWLFASILAIGDTRTFLIFTPASIVFCLVVRYLYIYNFSSKSRIVRFIQNWIKKKENELVSADKSGFEGLISKIISYSKIIGLTFSALTIGPLPTTLLVEILQYPKKVSITLIITLNVLFFIVWISIYSGTILIVNLII